MTTEQTTATQDAGLDSPPRLPGEIRAIVNDYLMLAGLKAQMTISVVLRLLILAIVAALALVSAWIALSAAAGFALISMGVNASLAILCIVAANLVIAAACWMRIRRLNQWFSWAADTHRGES